MSQNQPIIRIPERLEEVIFNRVGVSRVTKIESTLTDTYRDSAGNRIEDTTFSWFQGPDSAFCSNGAQPTDAQIQAAIRNISAGREHESSGNQTVYEFSTPTSPLERMCNIAPRPARGR